MQVYDPRLVKAARRTLRAELTLVAIVIIISCWTLFAIYKLYIGFPTTILSWQTTKGDVLADDELGHVIGDNGGKSSGHQHGPDSSASVAQIGKLADSPLFDWNSYLNGKSTTLQESNVSGSIWRQNPTQDQLNQAKDQVRQSGKISDSMPVWLRPIEKWIDPSSESKSDAQFNHNDSHLDTRDAVRRFTFPKDAKPTLEPTSSRLARVTSKPIKRPMKSQDEDRSRDESNDYYQWPSMERTPLENDRDVAQQSEHINYQGHGMEPPYTQHPLDDGRGPNELVGQQYHDHDQHQQQPNSNHDHNLIPPQQASHLVHEPVVDRINEDQYQPIYNGVSAGFGVASGGVDEEENPSFRERSFDPNMPSPNPQTINTRNMVQFDDTPNAMNADRHSALRPKVGESKLGQMLSQIIAPREKPNFRLTS